MTSQVWYDSDGHDAGLIAAVDLINVLAIDPPADPLGALRVVLAIDPPSVARLRPRDVAPFTELAATGRHIIERCAAGDLDDAANSVNTLLAEHSAHPHLAKEGGRWRLHHHPADAALAPMWTAIVAEAFARLIDDDRTDRAGICAAPNCARAYIDQSKNASRRFCSLACQNRVKAATFRQRRSTAAKGEHH